MRVLECTLCNLVTIWSLYPSLCTVGYWGRGTFISLGYIGTERGLPGYMWSLHSNTCIHCSCCTCTHCCCVYTLCILLLFPVLFYNPHMSLFNSLRAVGLYIGHTNNEWAEKSDSEGALSTSDLTIDTRATYPWRYSTQHTTVDS